MRAILILTILTCTLINFNAQVNLTSSLSACYSLNGNANDQINSLNGSLNGVSSTTDRFNNANSALYFSGSSSSAVLLPNSTLIKPNNAVSVSGWFKVSSFINDALVIFTKNSSQSFFTAYALTVQYNGGYKFAAWRQNGNNGSNFVECTTAISTNTWYHVVFTINSSNMQIYINGQLENTISNTISSFNYDNNTGVVLGGSNESGWNVPYNGCIDNLRIYSRVINSSEVSDLYTQDPSCLTSAPLPSASFSISSGKICQGGTVSVTDISTGSPTSWTWTAPGGISQNANTSSPTYTFNNPGVHSISLAVTNSVGPSSNTAVKSVTVYAKPVVTASASKTSACTGDLIQFTANGATSYLWMNQVPLKNYTANVTTSGSFSVTGTDANGCVNSASVFVKVNPLPVVTSSVSDAVICAGETVTLNATGAFSYVWSTSQTAANVAVIPSASTHYTVTGTDVNGCANKAVSSVTVNPLPIVNASASKTLICPGDVVGLNATGASTYIWSNNLPYANIFVVVDSDTTFLLTGTDVNGCENTTTIELKIGKDCGEVGIAEYENSVSYYPSPVKDKFRIKTVLRGDYKLEIYNMEGKSLLSQNHSEGESVVDISIFAPGVYFLKLTGKAENTVLKIIKQ